MSDVIWAAIIAVVGSSLGSFVAARVSYATVEKHTEIELAKVEADLEKLDREHHEGQRANRQAVYERLLAVLDRMVVAATYGLIEAMRADTTRPFVERA